MFFISTALDSYFLFRLKSEKYRANCFEKAVGHKLRFGKLNKILLRNLNKVMADNVQFHDEFKEMLNGKDFQQSFWESDLGYLWYQGSLHNQNLYFKYAIDEIKRNEHTSVLDVGCGWGEFSVSASKQLSVKKSYGIDVSESIILEAKKLHSSSGVVFGHTDVLDVNQTFDLITLFGSADYILPGSIFNVLEKIIQLTNKQIIIVNSLRKLPLNDALILYESIEIKRYDVGYVHPLKNHLDKLKLKYTFNYTFQKAGQDSLMVTILK